MITINEVNTRSLPIQVELARTVLDTYVDTASAAARLVMLLGPGTLTYEFPQEPASQFPAFVVARNANVAVVAIAGTANFQQAALQGLYGLAPPIGYGDFGTMLLWKQAASWIRGKMSDSGVSLGVPVVLTGHSYGGAVAQVIAAEIAIADPGAQLRVLTFGAPKAGDQRLELLHSNLDSLAIANAGDPVPSVPPSKNLGAIVFGFVPLPIIINWGKWRAAGENMIVSVEGEVVFGDVDSFDLGVVKQLLLDAFAGNPHSPIGPHSMTVYVDRLLMIEGPP